MIADNTGVVLTPGDNGINCLGNGAHYDATGKRIECCCDECDYAQCCLPNACLECGGAGSCPKKEC